MNKSEERINRQLVEQATSVSRLADQAKDRRIKTRLITITYKLLDLTEVKCVSKAYVNRRRRGVNLIW